MLAAVQWARSPWWSGRPDAAEFPVRLMIRFHVCCGLLSSLADDSSTESEAAKLGYVCLMCTIPVLVLADPPALSPDCT